jgi:hypothetical protein
MHPNAIKTVAEKLKSVGERMVYPTGMPNAGKPILAGSERSESYQLDNETNHDLDEIVDSLLTKHKYGQKYSEKYVRGELERILGRVLEAHSVDVIQGEVDGLDRGFEAFAESHNVVLPLSGVELQVNELKLGNVNLVQMAGSAADSLRGRWHSIIERNTYYSRAEKQQILEDIDRRLANMVDKCCATITVSGDYERAFEVALDETRRAVDLLRFVTFFLSGDKKYSIGIQGEVGDGLRSTVAIRSDGDAYNFVGVAAYRLLSVNQQIVDLMTRVGVSEVSDLVKKRDRTEFEELIVRGVHWLASGQSQFENENALLNFVTCIEAFLKPADKDPITATIAEGTAILIRTTLEDRKKCVKRIKHFYGLRSKLTHEGLGQITDSELFELRKIARELTVTLIPRRGEFKTQEDLRRWLEDKKLSG